MGKAIWTVDEKKAPKKSTGSKTKKHSVLFNGEWTGVVGDNQSHFVYSNNENDMKLFF